MNAEDVLPLEHLQVLRLELGDVLVLTFPGELTFEMAAKIRERIVGEFPGHKVLIIDSGASMGVIRSGS